ncbi:hypothetical protein HA466_0222280 [Hirschfeldia incana]|nr:hypothetical protein HA466_0222280 [Hirschfeldia incana]
MLCWRCDRAPFGVMKKMKDEGGWRHGRSASTGIGVYKSESEIKQMSSGSNFRQNSDGEAQRFGRDCRIWVEDT